MTFQGILDVLLNPLKRNTYETKKPFKIDGVVINSV